MSKVRFGASREEALRLLEPLGFSSFCEWLDAIPGASYREASAQIGGSLAPLMIAEYQREEMVSAGRQGDFDADCLVRYLADYRTKHRAPTVVRVAATLSSWADLQGRELPVGLARWIVEHSCFPESISDPRMGALLERLRQVKMDGDYE